MSAGRHAGRRALGLSVSGAVVLGLVPATALASGRAGAAAGGGGRYTTSQAGAARGAGAAGVISTVAGGVGGPAGATKVALPGACGVSFAAGAMFVADEGAVRKVSPQTGKLTTPAGTGAGAPLGDGGLAARAGFGTCSIAVDAAGNLVIADPSHARVRLVAARTGSFYGRLVTAGDIYTVAGNGSFGFSGDGGPATQAKLDDPSGVTVDGAGNIVLADTDNERVRVVAASTGRFYGRAMTAGDIYTVAGDGVTGFSGDGGPATSAEFRLPQGVATDGVGNLLITDQVNQRVRVVAASTGRFYGRAMTAGDIYTVAGDGAIGFSGDGGPATSAKISFPSWVTVDGAGNLVIADWGNNRIRVVAVRTGTFYGQAMTAGDIYTVAGDGTSGFSGDGGPATSAAINTPNGVAVDAAGNILIADQFNNRIRVVAVRTATAYGQAMTAGDIYTVAGNGTTGFSGDGGPALRAQLGGPSGVAVDGAGNLVIADTFNNRIRVAAASTGRFYGRPMTAGDIYTVAGGGTHLPGDGGPATKAELIDPQGVVLDGSGNLVIADTFGQRIRVAAARTSTFYGQAMTAGDIYTVAGTGMNGFSGNRGPATKAKVNDPFAAVLDGAGNLVIADTQNKRIRVVAVRTGRFYGQAMTAGDIYTVAGTGGFGYSGDGGPALRARLRHPQAVAVDGAGNLLIADTLNNRVRVVAVRTGTFYGRAMTAGDIYTVAGTGKRGFSGDGGPAASAQLGEPSGVLVDGAGNLLIADTFNSRVRVVAVRTGTFYGRAMTAGDIYTVAGTGRAGFSGDGGPATAAELSDPLAAVLDGAGGLVITDSGTGRIRVVAG